MHHLQTVCSRLGSKLVATNMDQHRSHEPMDIDQPEEDLLSKMQKMIEVEQKLSRTMRKVEPWLENKSKTTLGNRPRVRPIPKDMETVEKILAVARNLSSRTSAPAGWNSNAPVMGFTTPSPLPHQLRGGVLASMQLDRARQSERDRKRQQKEDEEKAAADAARKSRETTNTAAGSGDHQRTDETDPKRRDLQAHNKRPSKPGGSGPPSAQAPQPAAVAQVDMNLSSSDSDDDSD